MSKECCRVAMVLFSYYPSDPRPRREAEALITAGISVDMFCLRQASEDKRETIHGVRIFRLPIQRRRSGKLRYFWQYMYFTFLAFIALVIMHIRKPYDIIHIHNMPDFLALSALFPRWRGAKVILDLHDPMPEVYMAKYALAESHLAIHVLRHIEKSCITLADLVITPNQSFRDLFVSRGCPPEKIHIIMNSPQESIFHKSGKKKDPLTSSNNGSFVLMYHGTIIERNGIIVALEAIAKVRQSIPGVSFEVYGEGDFVDRFIQRIYQLNLQDIVHFHGHVPAEKIVGAIESADLGLIPNKASLHWDLAFPTRMLEYICLGKPVIVPRTQGIMDYFYEDSLYFSTPGCAEDLARKILDVYTNPEECRAKQKLSHSIYKTLCWDQQKHHLITLVSSLMRGNECQINLEVHEQETPSHKESGI